ncbi:MAG: OmpH family outer membrane protein [Pseudomonadota bacterium]
MKKLLFFTAFFYAVCCTASISRAADLKIGYVDIQKAVSESIAGKNASDKFKDDVKKAEDGLLKEKNEVEKLGEMLEKQSVMLTEDVRRDKEKDFLRRKRDYERLLKDQQTELQIKESELKNDILENLIPIIQKYGKENNFSIIFGKSDVVLLYASETLDVTDKIVALYDGEHKNKPAKSEKSKK